MDFYDFKSAMLLGFFMSFMIGPVFFMLLETSIVKGARAAISFNLGVITGDITFILIAYFGSRSLLEKIKDDSRLFFIGGLILVVYGATIFFKTDVNKKAIHQNDILQNLPKNDYIKLFVKGFFLNFINIGVLAFWLGTIVIVGPTLNMNQNLIFLYFGVVLLTYFTTDVVKILLAKQLKNKLTTYVIFRIKKTIGVFLVFFGFILCLKGFVSISQIESFLKFI